MNRRDLLKTMGAAAGSTLLLSKGAPDAEDRTLLIGLWMVPALTYLSLQSELCRSAERIGAAYTLPLLLRPVLILIAAGATVLAVGRLSGMAVVLIAGLSTIPVALLQRFVFRRDVERELQSVPRLSAFRAWFDVALPLALISGFGLILSQTDLLLIGALIDPREAGLYKAAARTASTVGFVLVAVNAAAAPRYSALHAAGRTAELQRLVAQLARWIFWPSLAVAGLVALLSELLLGLFGPAFLEARVPLLILAAGYLLHATAGPVGYLLSMTGHHRRSLAPYVVSALLNIPLNLLGLHLMGLVGAAFATTLSLVLWNGWMILLVRRHLGLDPTIFPVFRRSGAGSSS